MWQLSRATSPSVGTEPVPGHHSAPWERAAKEERMEEVSEASELTIPQAQQPHSPCTKPFLTNSLNGASKLLTQDLIIICLLLFAGCFLYLRLEFPSPQRAGAGSPPHQARQALHRYLLDLIIAAIYWALTTVIHWTSPSWCAYTLPYLILFKI